LRAKEQPTVSTPVSWDEVEQCLKKEDAQLLVFTSEQVLKRVDKMGDLFEPVLKLKQKLPAIEKLTEISPPAAGTVVAKTASKRTPAATERARVMAKRPKTRRKVG
jgi:bifunctional non-homologous end joining protein LigD